MPSSFCLISEYTRPLHLQTKTSPDLNPTLNKAGAFSVSYHTNSADSWPSSTIYCLRGLRMITIGCEDRSSSVQQVRAVDEGRQADRLPQHSSAPVPAFLARRSLETWASKAPSAVLCRSDGQSHLDGTRPLPAKGLVARGCQYTKCDWRILHEPQDQVFHMMHTR